MDYFDLSVHGRFLGIVLLVLVGIHADVVESKLLLDPILEQLPLLQSQTIRLCNNGHHIHRLAQLFEHDDIDRLQRVAGGGDEVETAVDAGVLDVALTLSCELLAEVGGVLVFDVLDDGIPAAVVVHEVAVARGVDDVQSQAHAVLLDDVRDGVDLGGLADGLVGGEAALAVDEVGGEDGVDECALAESGLACLVATMLANGRAAV